MRPLLLSEFAALASVSLVGQDAPITGFATDHREVCPGDLFLAIRGADVDGHDFVPLARAAGAVAALVEREVPGTHLRAESLVEALATFASVRRAAHQGPVVGITGSNGKTTTKELVAAALSPLGPILKSAGNRNTEYTAPLMWAELDGHKAVVSELAMRGFGQIAHLSAFTRPTVGVITMIGTAHIEMVGSREGIARAKAELTHGMATGDPLLLWAEDEFLGYLRGTARGPVRTFGFGPEAELRIVGYRAVGWRLSVARFDLGGTTVEVEAPTIGRHQARNMAAALLVADTLGVPLTTAAEAMAGAEWPPMRMEVVDLHGATVLLDAYNASPDSTVAAIQALGEVPCDGDRVAVLGEMLELGEFAESGHRQVGRVLAESPVDRAVLLGPLAAFIADEAIRSGLPEARLILVKDLSEVADALRALAPGDVALVKGSRALALERALVEAKRA